MVTGIRVKHHDNFKRLYHQRSPMVSGIINDFVTDSDVPYGDETGMYKN